MILKNKCSIGNHLYNLRKDEGIMNGLHPYNHYLMKAYELKNLVYTVPEVEESFPGIFQNPAQPVLVEIGCYMGSTVVELADNNPGYNILGVDIKYKRVVKSCNKIKRRNLPNAKIALADIGELLPVLPDNSLQVVCAFFPDPWQKNKQKKHRFLNETFFKELAGKLSPEGFFWLKTDDEAYFEETGKIAGKHGFLLSRELPLQPLREEHKTLFEQIFIRENKPIYQLILKR
ncbi:MAG: tRNA (guanosine(46)-N7)-methyltransferase TrmB [bacterium]|nr:tRNA (guanosine(46)-N7)-methyltransferase TrmB [bacterium]